ncbi:NAD(P)-dependent oxidoreductase [Streptomyces canus]|uniref:NAD-dependent epimerase/dehydratase family protein n=1 Tax=Streptomyces canus TaxID=58343 RepID=UPI0030E0C503
MPSSESVLVTGVSGFIGGFLSSRLSATGWKVSGVDRRPPSEPSVCADFTQACSADPAVLKAVAEGRYKAVLHQAAISNTLETDWDALLEHNVVQPLRLAEACAASATLFVYASSFSVYGRSERLAMYESADEDGTSGGPLNLYARSKLLLDQKMRQQQDRSAPRIGLRYTNVFGVGEPVAGRASSIISKILHAAAVRRPIDIFSDTLTAGRDYVPVERIHEFVQGLLDGSARVPSGVYNLGSGTAVSFAELLDWAARFAGPDGLSVRLVANPIAARYQYWTQADNSAIAAQVPGMGPMSREAVREHARAAFDFYAAQI